MSAGSSDILAELAEHEITDDAFQTELGRLLSRWDYELPNKEALYYYQILRKSYKDNWIFPTKGRSRSL